MPAAESDRALLAFLRRELAQRGARLRPLSSELGWHPDYLGQLLAGRVGLQVDHLYTLAAWLGEPAGELMARFEGRDPAPVADAETALRNRLAELVLASLRDLLRRWPQPVREDDEEPGGDVPERPSEEG